MHTTNDLAYGSDAYISNPAPLTFDYSWDYSWLSAAPYEASGEYVYTDVTHTLADASIINDIFAAGFRPEDLGYYIMPATEIIT